MNGNIEIKKLAKAETEIILHLPWEEIKNKYEEVVNKSAADAQIKGFRKGKAPKKLVEETLDKSKVYSLVVQEILPSYYETAIKDNNLKPIVNPKVSLDSAKENENWEVRILIAEKPQFSLGNYKEEIVKINKSAEIWVPGKDEGKKDKENDPQAIQKKKDEKIQAALKWLSENIKMDFSDLIIEEEVNRRLSQLVEQTQKLGLTIEQYLVSTGKSVDQIKSEYQKEAASLWQIEFILEEISDKENLTVEEKEINELIEKAGSEEEKKA
ncbi:MAG TPA: trigger factor, partial [Candidatus Woesebacteria bacterium]|nr:trigger factor [Candidatus Woesebacteria bacterium]